MAARNGSGNMSSQEAAPIFADIRGEDPLNAKCLHCSNLNPQWASVTFGALICLECAGKHRSLGVHLSFIRSVTMDSWSPRQITMMTSMGGNAPLVRYFAAHGIDVCAVPIPEIFDSAPAAAYREHVRAIADGKTPKRTECPPPKEEEKREAPQAATASTPAAPTGPTSRVELPHAARGFNATGGFGSSDLHGNAGTDANGSGAAGGGGGEIDEILGALTSGVSFLGQRVTEATARAAERINEGKVLDDVKSRAAETYSKAAEISQRVATSEVGTKVRGTLAGIWALAGLTGGGAAEGEGQSDGQNDGNAGGGNTGGWGLWGGAGETGSGAQTQQQQQPAGAGNGNGDNNDNWDWNSDDEDGNGNGGGETAAAREDNHLVMDFSTPESRRGPPGVRDTPAEPATPATPSAFGATTTPAAAAAAAAAGGSASPPVTPVTPAAEGWEDFDNDSNDDDGEWESFN